MNLQLDFFHFSSTLNEGPLFLTLYHYSFGIIKKYGKTKRKYKVFQVVDEIEQAVKKGCDDAEAVLDGIALNSLSRRTTSTITLKSMRGGFPAIYEKNESKGKLKGKRADRKIKRTLEQIHPDHWIHKRLKETETPQLTAEQVATISQGVGISLSQERKLLKMMRKNDIRVPRNDDVRMYRIDGLPIKYVTGSQRYHTEYTDSNVRTAAKKNASRYKGNRKKKPKNVEALQALPLPSTKTEKVPSSRVETFSQSLYSFLLLLSRRGELLWHPLHGEDTLWIGVGMDKGGSTTKMTLSILSTNRPTSCRYMYALATYEGEETSELMHHFFSPILEEINELARRGLDEEALSASVSDEFAWNDEKTSSRARGSCRDDKCKSCAAPKRVPASYFKKIKVFFLSDMKCTLTALGMASANSTYSCVYCWRTARQDATQKAEARDLRTMHGHYEKYVEGGKDRSKQAQNMNMVNLPIFPLEADSDLWDPPNFVAPFVLHVVLGLGKYLCDWIEEATVRKDYALVQADEAKIDGFISARKNHSRLKEQYDDLISQVDDTKLNIRRWDFTLEDLDLGNEEQNQSDHNKEVEMKKLKRLEKKVEKKMEEIDVHEASIDILPHHRYLQDQWKHANLNRLVYYQGSLNGNDIRRIFDVDNPLYMQLLSALDDRKGGHNTRRVSKEIRKVEEDAIKTKEAFSAICKQFAKIRHLSSLSRFLCESEIVEYEESVKAFAKHIRTLRKMGMEDADNSCMPRKATFSNFPKLHILLGHSVDWLRKYKTLGVMSETGVERFHRITNQVAALFSHLKGEKRLLMINQTMVRKLVAPEVPEDARICPKCDQYNRKSEMEHCLCLHKKGQKKKKKKNTF